MILNGNGGIEEIELGDRNTSNLQTHEFPGRLAIEKVKYGR